jgi:hypothetical protein
MPDRWATCCFRRLRLVTGFLDIAVWRGFVLTRHSALPDRASFSVSPRDIYKHRLSTERTFPGSANSRRSWCGSSGRAPISLVCTSWRSRCSTLGARQLKSFGSFIGKSAWPSMPHGSRFAQRAPGSGWITTLAHVVIVRWRPAHCPTPRAGMTAYPRDSWLQILVLCSAGETATGAAQSLLGYQGKRRRSACAALAPPS